jgi:hypothetical protein
VRPGLELKAAPYKNGASGFGVGEWPNHLGIDLRHTCSSGASRVGSDSPRETRLRAQKHQGGAHPRLERSVGNGLAELDGTTRLAGAEPELAQARHHVPAVFFGNSW